MKLATFNVNGVNGRLPVLLRWLDETAPDIVCLQELKASQDKFPEGPIRDAGYGAIWHGQKSWNGVAILVRGADPVETRRGLPGDPDDTNSRYIEAAANGLLVGCLYLPNGNPAPGPKRRACCARRRLQRHAHRSRRLRAGAMGRRRPVPPGSPRRLSKPRGPGLDRCAANTPSGRAYLYLLGLFPERLRPRRRTAHRPYPAQSCGSAAT